jgi:general secretion pathway protein H
VGNLRAISKNLLRDLIRSRGIGRRVSGGSAATLPLAALRDTRLRYKPKVALHRNSLRSFSWSPALTSDLAGVLCQRSRMVMQSSVRLALKPLATVFRDFRGNNTLHPAQRGFTLLELLVVMVIAGIILGMVSFKAMPDDRQVLQQDAQRIALLLQVARDEAIVRNRPIAFEADANRYRFLIREEQSWQVLNQDEMLRERDFKRSPVSFAITPANTTLPLRILFGREPVDKPFVLTLIVGEAHAAIQADGIGHFSVE